ncbi:metal ABC transporter solute-binding protein, Zn/Mn family [Pseudonocardia sp. KRD291]|uniref:metal ABC transporter solute-binding protein, Zn/Mn family n=1 Tax=Pseudonocardia sp. KRD291 TaxID=2792007 RepID=UPI001C49FB83|nr:zinc ABC transporter substrate-binding protein [Pseudonocardia sp. KRD291]MBW0103597.1 zinc ABC transporter substrate-binding protein [Pseudonocardia sp. KRD291]
MSRSPRADGRSAAAGLPRAAATVAGLAAVTLGLSACGSPDAGSGSGSAAPSGEAPGQVQVVASTDVWGSVAKAVGGDRVAVTSIIDSPEKDPHEYEATPTDATSVGRAGLVLVNGGGYDAFMSGLVDASGNTAPVVDAVALSGLEGAGEAAGAHAHEGEEAAHEGEQAGGEAGHEHGAFNEHVWYSLPTVQKVANDVAARLGTIDPAGAAAYTANAQRFDASVTGLTQKAGAIGAAHPGAKVAVTEPVPGYLLEAAKLQDVTPEEFSESVEEGNDPPAAVLQQTLALFTAQPPVSALVLNGQTQTPTTDQVKAAATTAAVPVVEVTETLPEGTGDYAAWMGAQIDALAGALDKR